MVSKTERYIHERIDACKETLAFPKVARALGGLADELISLADELHYVPRYRGEFDYDSNPVTDEKIPIYTAGYNTVKAPLPMRVMHTLHPTQVENLRQYLDDKSLGAKSDSAMTGYTKAIEESAKDRYTSKDTSIDFRSDAAAAVMHVYGKLQLKANARHDSRRQWVRTRPVVVYRTGLEDDDGTRLIHELVHVRQNLNDIIFNKREYDNRLTSHELEAYGVANMIDRALKRRPGETGHWFSHEVEQLRRASRTTTSGPYGVTRSLRKLMQENGYDYGFGDLPEAETSS